MGNKKATGFLCLRLVPCFAYVGAEDNRKGIPFVKIVSLLCKLIQFLMVALSVTVHKTLILLVFLNHPYQSLALADLSSVLPNVCSRKEEIVQCITEFCTAMHERSADMKRMENYKTGENYAYLGLSPHFLVFDEYVAFMEMLTSREREDVLNKLRQIVMLGRQAGFFLILACQRPDAKYLGDGIRDQFNFRVALGRMSELGYSMMFGETKKEFFFKNIKGRGYADTGKGVITEFYTPIVPKGYDFLQEIGRCAK